MLKVRILNPPPEWSDVIQKMRAKELVRRGLAFWNYGHAEITLTASALPVTVAEHPRNSDATGLRYDRISRRMEQRELRHIPFVGPNVRRMLL